MRCCARTASRSATWRCCRGRGIWASQTHRCAAAYRHARGRRAHGARCAPAARLRERVPSRCSSSATRPRSSRSCSRPAARTRSGCTRSMPATRWPAMRSTVTRPSTTTMRELGLKRMFLHAHSVSFTGRRAGISASTRRCRRISPPCLMSWIPASGARHEASHHSAWRSRWRQGTGRPTARSAPASQMSGSPMSAVGS